mmetsp:Transcript_10884/g.11901  ORF Transcript_10884/g.11901 Transcript_10884/m.11901 type:complete len:211 (-) Transcript_10884:193-825(-)
MFSTELLEHINLFLASDNIDEGNSLVLHHSHEHFSERGSGSGMDNSFVTTSFNDIQECQHGQRVDKRARSSFDIIVTSLNAGHGISDNIFGPGTIEFVVGNEGNILSHKSPAHESSSSSDDLSTTFESGNGGQGFPDTIDTLHESNIGGIDRGRIHLDQHLSTSGLGDGHLNNFEIFFSITVDQLDGLHCSSSFNHFDFTFDIGDFFVCF